MHAEPMHHSAPFSAPFAPHEPPRPLGVELAARALAGARSNGLLREAIAGIAGLFRLALLLSAAAMAGLLLGVII